MSRADQNFRRTSIVATLGPRTRQPAMIRRLVAAGMSVARINFSHTSEPDVRALVRGIRDAAGRAGRPVAIMGDLPGPKLRPGPVESGPVLLRRGQEVRLYTRRIPTTVDRLGVDLRALVRDVKPGDRLLIDDGRVRLRALDITRDYVLCHVDVGGRVGATRGLNLPDTRLKLPALTRRDRELARLSVHLDLDYLALSFVRHSRDILALRRLLRSEGSDLPVIAKIEKPEALDDLPAIIAASDGVMVARGDLGVELSVEDVPATQRRILMEAQRQFKPAIVATQMLESMIEQPSPTRAEVSDVANAVFDGADAIMLSGETAVGAYPVEAVRTMHRVAVKAECVITPDATLEEGRTSPDALVQTAAMAAVRAAGHLGARCLVCHTESGRTARMLSMCRPQIPILGLASSPRTLRRLCLYRGVTPWLLMPGRSYDSALSEIRRLLLSEKQARPGDLVVLLSATPIRRRGQADTIKFLRIERPAPRR